MFKKQRINRKSNQNLIAETFVENVQAFKSGSIELSVDDVLLMKLDELNKISAMPEIGKQNRIVTQKAINSFDFILAVLAESNVEELIMAFYRIGKKVAVELKNLHDSGRIKNLHFLVNDGIPKLTPDAYNFLKGCENENWKIRLAHNHTKIILLKTESGNFYVVEGSGNLSANARIEQYVVDNNKSIYVFHKNWITKL